MRKSDGWTRNQPIRQPVIAQFLENVLTKRMRSSGVHDVHERGGATAAEMEQRVDLVGDDPETVTARQVENGLKRFAVGRPAGRVRRAC